MSSVPGGGQSGWDGGGRRRDHRDNTGQVTQVFIVFVSTFDFSSV